jgi:DNA-binding CsgD family transcriptional regulator
MENLRLDLTAGDALVAFGSDLRVLAWNDAAEALTGIRAADAIGRGCWEVLDAFDSAGAAVCRPDCSTAYAAFRGAPQSCRELLIKTRTGRRSTMVSTLAMNGGATPLCVHMLTPLGELTPEEQELARDLESLTPRQRDVLALVAKGMPAKVIAAELAIAERTVRNYIHEILLMLRCRTQLEALAKLAKLRGRVAGPAAR